MEQLFFTLQKDKKLKRHIQLLTYINEKAILMSELANLLACSTPTLREDISILNRELGINGQISITSYRMVNFTSDTDFSIDSFITILIEKSFVYQIINCVFHQKNWSLQRATLELLISKSHLFKIIRHMNQILEKYGIAIQTKHLTFLGDEKDIRVFLFNFYFSLGRRDIVTKNSIEYAKTFSSLLNHHDQIHLNFCHFRLSIWIPILITRVSHRQFVFFSNHLSQMLEARLVKSKGFETFNTILKKHYGFPNEEIVWLYFSSLYCITYSDIKCHGLMTDAYIYHRETPLEEMLHVRQALEAIFSKDMIENGDTKLIESFLINLNLLMLLSTNFGFLSSNLRSMIEKNHINSFHKWLWLLETQDLFETSPPSYLLEDIAISLTTLHATLIKKNQCSKKLHILYAFQGEYGFDDYLVQMTKSIHTQNVTADYFLKKILDKKAIAHINPDLIVCNYDLGIKSFSRYPIIRFSTIPTLNDWNELKNEIELRLTETYS